MSDDQQDVQGVRGSRDLRNFLGDLQSAGHISGLVDGYRLCVAVACAFHLEPDPNRSYDSRQLMFAGNTIDTPDQSIRTAIREIYPTVAATPYRVVEDLAEQGAAVVKRQMVGDDLSFSDLLERVNRAAQEGGTP